MQPKNIYEINLNTDTNEHKECLVQKEDVVDRLFSACRLFCSDLEKIKVRRWLA